MKKTITTSRPKTARKPRTKLTYVAKDLPSEGRIRLPTVLQALGICRSTFLNGVKGGKYPPGELISPCCRTWNVQEIREIAKLKA